MQVEPATESNSPLPEEVVKEKHYSVQEDPELLEEFHAVLENIKCEVTDSAEDIQTVDIKPPILSENYLVPKSEQNLEFSEVIFESNNRITAPSLCRLCARSGNEMVYMFSPDKSHQNIIEKIEHCLPIVVRETDTLPKQACNSCLKKLELCHEFYKAVAEAEKQLIILGKKVADEFWATEKHFRPPLLNKQCSSLKQANNEGGLRICSDEDSNNNQSATVPHEIKITNLGTTESSNGLSNNLNKDDINRYSSMGGRNTDSYIDTNIIRKTIRCRICGRIFRTVKKCLLHSSVHALANYYPCTLCDESFIAFNNWNVHSLEHIKGKEYEGRPATHVCNDCGKKFITEIKLQLHKISHSSDAKLPYCKTCDKIMNSEATLNQHMLTLHPQDMKHRCEICGMQFRNQSQLNGHQGKHTKKRIKENFSCAHCEKSFTQKWSLIIHIRSHTGERPFSCDFCDKKYKTQAQRNSHRRTHTDEKPFKCSTCEKTFAQALRLSEHIANVHTIIRPYKCSLCDKSFKRIHARTIHMTTHTGEKPYQCDICKRSFRWPSAIRRHKRDQHGVKWTTVNNLKKMNNVIEDDCK